MSAISSVKTDSFSPHPAMGRVCNVQGPTTEVELSAGALWSVETDGHWRMIICLRGSIWITQERDLDDYVLEAGEAFVVTQPGQVLVQALEDTRIEITPSAEKRPYRGKYPVFK